MICESAASLSPRRSDNISAAHYPHAAAFKGKGSAGQSGGTQGGRQLPSGRAPPSSASCSTDKAAHGASAGSSSSAMPLFSLSVPAAGACRLAHRRPALPGNTRRRQHPSSIRDRYARMLLPHNGGEPSSCSTPGAEVTMLTQNA